MNARALTWAAALSGAAALVIWKAGDVLALMFTPEVAAVIIRYLLEGIVMLLVGFAAIAVGWTTTRLFRDLMLIPDVDDKTGKKKWEVHTRRLMLCSFVWTFLTCFAALSLRYLHDAPARQVLERLLYIFIGAIVVSGISIPAYDIIVKRAWPKFLRHFFPTKFVQTPNGVDERPADEPSDPTTEKTIVLDRTQPRPDDSAA